MTINDIIEAKFFYTCGDDRALNIRHYVVDPGDLDPAAVTLQNCADGIRSEVAAALVAARRRVAGGLRP